MYGTGGAGLVLVCTYVPGDELRTGVGLPLLLELVAPGCVCEGWGCRFVVGRAAALAMVGRGGLRGCDRWLNEA